MHIKMWTYKVTFHIFPVCALKAGLYVLFFIAKILCNNRPKSGIYLYLTINFCVCDVQSL